MLVVEQGQDRRPWYQFFIPWHIITHNFRYYWISLWWVCRVWSVVIGMIGETKIVVHILGVKSPQHCLNPQLVSYPGQAVGHCFSVLLVSSRTRQLHLCLWPHFWQWWLTCCTIWCSPVLGLFSNGVHFRVSVLKMAVRICCCPSLKPLGGKVGQYQGFWYNIAVSIS